MIRRGIRSSLTALAVAFFAVPQISLAQANDQAQVDPLVQKAARVKAMNTQMRFTQAQREEAIRENKANVERVKAAKAAARAKGIEVPDIGIRGVRAERASNGKMMRAGAPRSTSATALPVSELPPGMGPIGPLDTPDYFTISNWAFSPMLRKFVDPLPLLGEASQTPSRQNFIPLAHPDTITYPGADYYEIEVREYTHQFHSDLPPTHVRGYVQVNNGTDAQGANTIAPETINWLGPVIIANKDRPVRLLFRNMLPGGEAGNLNVPVDESIMGSGKGPLWPDGTVCDPSPKGVNIPGDDCALYPQSRVSIHLHGGRTPWISDGTPHQWFLPQEDFDNPLNPYKKGVSFYNVPDMPVPAANEATFYWTNQQSARLMFYHDHAWGITRLNVLVGMAAGLLITDPTEQALIAEGILPDVGTPLVLQERTFVNAAVNPLSNPAGQTFVRETDPTWNWGSGTVDVNGIRTPMTGDFWVPHVYIVAQNPYTPSGVNAFGRWVYGPWFFPPTANLFFPPVPNPYHDPNCSDPDPAVLAFCTTPNQPPVIPGTPLPSVGAETFFDTAMVNGQAFPVMDVDPKPYRFRILNASNDRFFNLNLYEADPLQVAQTIPGGLPPATNTEVAMCAVPGPVPPMSQICWNEADFPNWPVDGRTEGVPNPGKLGPDIIYLGTEGGFLPKPVVLTGQPITWVGDPTFFNAGNIDLFNLFLGPAERADVLIDFSAWGGKELILYNDAPAAVPAFDPRFDYVTGAPDLSESGGYGRVPPWNEAIPGAPLEGPQIGYGPNTRTVMKFRVAAGTGPGYDVAKLFERWAPGLTPAGRTSPLGVFEEGQDPIIVGQADYDGVYVSNPTFPSVWPAWGLSRIEDNSLMFETVGGTYVTFPMEPKAIHDEMGASFDKEYARMSTNLGTQLPIPKTNNANMTPFMYTDPTTEFLNAALEPISPVLGDGTQLWKISHNGVDMHPIHFHIFDVQVINRVGWDGMIRLPAPTELGWKDTVRIAPLEDTIVAMRPWTPPLPFAIPFSLRPLNPAIPIGSGFGFTNVDPITQNPLVPPTVNSILSFAWEYVWHCHILSHEENDMMRAVVVNVNSSIPPAMVAPTVTPVNTVTADEPVLGNRVTWTDPTPVDYVTQTGFSGTKNGVTVDNLEIGFYVQRATSATAAYITVGTARANQTTFLDTSRASATTYYRYRVVAFNEAGESISPFTSVNTPATPALTSVSVAVNNASTAAGITTTVWTKRLTSSVTPNFRATPNPTTALAEYQFELRMGTGAYAIVQAYSPSRDWVMPLATAGTVAGQAYTVRVSARTSNAATAPVRQGTRAYTVRIPQPALALTLIPDIASPVEIGNDVTFTATATGTTAAVQYQFLLGGAVVQAWGTANTWMLPGTSPVGPYSVEAQVRTTTAKADVVTPVTYEIINPVATGVTLQLDPTALNPGPAPVKFLATGQGPLPLLSATGGGYFFRFWRSPGLPAAPSWTMVQDYSTSRVYTMTDLTPDGDYDVRADVRTSDFPTSVVLPSNIVSITKQSSLPATGVTFTSIVPASPGTYGTPATFTAVATGGAVGATYSYRFTLDGGAPSAWNTTNTFVLPGTTLGGSHTVTVDATTEPVPTTVQTTTSTTYVIDYPAATGVVFSAIAPTSAQPIGTTVNFTAAGSSSIVLPASAYKYQFSLNNVVVQPWSSSATYAMIGNNVEGAQDIKVDVTTEAVPATVQAFANTSYNLYGPATGVVFQTITPATPQAYGTAATFVALASGGGPVPAYQYRFLLNGTEVQGWSANASYLMDATTLGGIHTVRVEATSAPAPVPQSTGEVFAETTYVLNYPQATGATVAITPASSAMYGTAVTVEATGSSSVVLPAVAYKYQFLVNGSVVQDWSTSASYLGLGTTDPGAKEILVNVSTQNVPTTIQATAQASYSITTLPATGLTLSGIPVSPITAGTAVDFTAQGIGGAGPYQYRFDTSINGAAYTVRQAYSTTNTWTLPGTTPAGTTVVRVLVRTNPAVAEDLRTTRIYTINP